MLASRNIASPVAADPRGELAARLRKALQIQVRSAKTLSGLRRHLGVGVPALLVGDVALAGLVDVVESLRANQPTVNVLLLTSKPANARLSALLEFGAVDVLRKPFSDAELALRLRGLAALSPGLPSPTLSIPNSVTQLHDPTTGRIDAKRIAAAFGLSVRALARALNRKSQSVNKTPTAPSLQEQLGHYLRSYELLFKLLGGDEAVRAWLNSPQSDLAGERPIALIKHGQVQVVRNFLEAMYAGGPS